MSLEEYIMRDYFKRGPITFVSPIDGDCLNIYDGTEKDGLLYIKVKVKAQQNMLITINDKDATFNGEYFEIEYPLPYGRTILVAKDKENPEIQQSVIVFRLKNCTGIYRLSVDDNFLFLKDINDNKDKYSSIFDNEYLSLYKEAHEKYGASVQLNIHYEVVDYKGFSAERDYFNLTMMTDKFRQEWIDNSSWLKLSFHARDIQPDRPYKDTDMNRIAEDAAIIHKEIIRFAGEETLCSDSTTVHWAHTSIEGVRGLRNLGMKGLYGYFNILKSGKTSASYHYPLDIVEHVHERDFWVDTQEDMLFGKIDLVLNSHPLENIVPKLEEVKARPGNAGCLDIMIHEEYFYEDYSAYIPEFKQIVLTACKWAYDNGYKGYFMKDVMER